MTAEDSAAAATSGGGSADSADEPAASASSVALPPNRFELELEFVQSLASPAYLHYLATSGTLYQQSFLDFLRYLRYWKQPQYAKYLLYPHCLYFLDLLVPDDGDSSENGNIGGDGEKGEQSTTSTSGADSGEAFRREMAQVPFRNFVHEQQFYSWQFRSARLYGSSGVGVKGEEGNEGGAVTGNSDGG